MKKDLLKSADRVMLTLVFSLLCVLSSVTAVFSDSPTFPGCKCTWTITGASVKGASTVESSYEFTGSGSIAPHYGCPSANPNPFSITGTGTWTPDSPCPSETAGTAVEEIHRPGGPSISTTSHCPNNPWLNDNVQCSFTYNPGSTSAFVPALFNAITCPMSATLLTSAQKQALKGEEQSKKIYFAPKPKILSPGPGATFLNTSGVTIKVKHEPCFGGIALEFQWRKSANESWHDKNTGVIIQTDSGGIATATYLYNAGLWRIRASVMASYSDWREYEVIAVPLLPPSDLKAKANNDHEIALTWKASSNPGDGYEIWRRTGGVYMYPLKKVGAQVTNYTDSSGLSPGTHYCYHIRTFDIGENSYSPYCHEAQAKTPPHTIYIGDKGPKKPSNLTASPVSRTRIKLSWRVSTQEVGSKVDSFMIERKKQGAASFTPLTTVPPNATYTGGPNTYTDTGLLPGTTYFYRVKSHNSAGDSLYSNEASAKTMPSDVGIGNKPPVVKEKMQVPK